MKDDLELAEAKFGDLYQSSLYLLDIPWRFFFCFVLLFVPQEYIQHIQN